MVGTGGIGPGHRQCSADEFRVRVGARLREHQVELQRVIGLDDGGDLALIQTAEHFFGQRQPAGGSRQIRGIARGGRVAQRRQRFAPYLVRGTLGGTGQATGDITATARQVVQAGRQFLARAGFG
ncbi:hypothetical protein D3C76_1093890 [compost metagenome]